MDLFFIVPNSVIFDTFRENIIVISILIVELSEWYYG